MVAALSVEKLKPSYRLGAIQRAFDSADHLAATTTALISAAALGFDREGIVQTIATMTPKMFQKSMTTYADHRIWQDVYNVPAVRGRDRIQPCVLQGEMTMVKQRGAKEDVQMVSPVTGEPLFRDI
eukprot:gene54170-74156_t